MALFPSPQDLLNKVHGGPQSSPLFDTPTAPKIPSPDEVLTNTRDAGPSFTQNLLSKGKQIAGKIGSAIGGFLGEQKKVIQETPITSLTPSDVLEGVKTTAKGIGTGVKLLSEGFNEGVARIVKSTAEGVIGKERVEKISNFGGPVSIGSFSEAITGKDKVTTYQELNKMAQNFALENNASIDESKYFGGLAVIGALWADNPLVSGGKAAISISKEGIERLAKETAEDGIKLILKEEIPKITEAQLEALVPVFRNTTDSASVYAAIQNIDQAIKVPFQAADDVAEKIPSPDEVLGQSRQAFELPEEAAERAAAEEIPYLRAAADATGTKFERVTGQPVEISPALETFLRKGENDTYEVVEATTGRAIGKMAETPEAAIRSAQEAISGKTPEEIQAAVQALREQTPRIGRASRIPAEAGPLQKPFRRDFVRSISIEEDSGKILGKLSSEFPQLSENALNPVAKRLAGLSRSSDIEGILHVVRNINEELTAARASGKAAEIGKRSIAKVGAAEAVGDIPPSVGSLITTAEKKKYLDNVQKAIKTREDAVIAQQEYDALWEQADQRIIDRYEELRIQRDFLKETINEHAGAQVNALYKGTFLSPENVDLDDLINMRPKQRIDTRIEDIVGNPSGTRGRDSVVEAQKMLDDFKGMRKRLAEIEEEIREVRPRQKVARMLQEMVEDVPVISRNQAGAIESLANPEDVRLVYKDISGFQGQSRDLYRNFEQVFGTRYPEIKKIILDPFDRSKGEMVDEITKLADGIEENIVNKLGIKRGSKESAAVQLYGEGKLSQEDLVKMVGSDNVKKVIDATGYFRTTYDRLLDEVNEVRARIFPNDPSKLIPKRKDYFRHFQEMSDGFKKLIEIFETPAGIDPKLAGLSEFTKPKSKFLSFAQTRLGKDSQVDAIGGFLDYAPTFAYAKHIDQHIGNFRYLRRRLAENAPVPGTSELVAATDSYAAAMGGKELVKQKGLNNFLTYLDSFANDLAGKTNPMDRYMQMIIPGGRKTFKVLDWVNSRVKANTILGNASSAVAQAFNIPQGIASAKGYSIPGAQRTLASIFVENEPMLASAFIKERYQESLINRFKVEWVDHPVQAGFERSKEMAVWLTGVMDEVGTKFIWNSHYQKAIAEGIEDPIKYADDFTRRLVAGRGVGEVPLIQKSKLFQLFAPFQLEVANSWRVMGDFVKRKDFGALATFFVASYLMNIGAEKVRGSKVVFDPIEALIDGATQASDELEDTGSAKRAAFKFVGRQVGEILSNLPLGQTLAGGISDDRIESLSGGAIKDRGDLFGDSDPSRFGTGVVVKGLADPFYKLILPFGGGQLKKTVQGIQSMLEGQVKDKNNNLSFDTTRTVENVVKAFLFGKNATPEAKKFYDERSDLFNRIYRQDANRTEARVEAEKVWGDVKKLRDAGKTQEAVEMLQALENSDPELADAVQGVAEEEADGLSGTDRLVKMLGVDNGERAKYIAESVKGMKTREEQVQFLQQLDEKKLISDTVFEQLQFLLEGAIKSE